VCPNLEAANILYHGIKTTTSGGVTVGPILMGVAGAVTPLTPAATVRRVLSMTAVAAACARRPRRSERRGTTSVDACTRVGQRCGFPRGPGNARLADNVGHTIRLASVLRE